MLGVRNVRVVMVAALVAAAVAAVAWQASKDRLTAQMTKERLTAEMAGKLVSKAAQGRPPSTGLCKPPLWTKVTLKSGITPGIQTCAHTFCGPTCQVTDGRRCALSSRTVRGKTVNFCCDGATMKDCQKLHDDVRQVMPTPRPTGKPKASAAQVRATLQVKPFVQALIQRLDAVLAQAGQPGWGAKQPTDENKRLTAQVGGTRFTRVTHNLPDGGKRTFQVDPAANGNGSGTGFEVTAGGIVTAWEHDLDGVLVVIQQDKDGELNGWKSEKGGQITGLDKGQVDALVCKTEGGKMGGTFRAVLGKSKSCGARHVFPTYPYEHVSAQVGSEWAGTPFDMDCGPTGYIKGLNVGYDNKPKEVKFVAYSCHKGMRWDPRAGRYVDNGGGQHGRAGTYRDTHARIVNFNTLVAHSSYENRPMLEPDGFSSLHAITQYNNHNAKFLRALGTRKDNMFGVHGHTYVPQEHDRWIKTLSCQDALGRATAPGKKLRINRMTGFNDKNGVRSVRIHCTEQ